MNTRQDVPRSAGCAHEPPCPDAGQPDELAAHVIAAHPEQGWSLLCNGAVAFEDSGMLRPNGRLVAPPQPEPQGTWSRC